MATHIFRGDAPRLPQIDTITLSSAGAWATGEKINVTINGKTITLTIGSSTTDSDVARDLKETLAGETLTDTTAAVNYNDYEQYPEFNKITWSVSGAVVTATGDKGGADNATSGEPFVISSVTEDSTNGSAALSAEDQVAQSPNHWAAYNFDSGVLPGAGDTVYLQASAVDILYDLDQSGAGTITAIYKLASFTGRIGRPPVNNDLTVPYADYLDGGVRFAKWHVSTLDWEDGEGFGSPRALIDLDNVACAVIIHHTGQSDDTTRHALVLKGTSASNTLVIYDGDIDLAPFDDDTAVFATIATFGNSSVRASRRVTIGTSIVCAETSSADIWPAATCPLVSTLDQAVATLRGTATITTLSVFGATVEEQGGARTVTNFSMGNDATYDVSGAKGTITHTNEASISRGCTVDDRTGKLSWSAGFGIIGGGLHDITYVTADGPTIDVS